MHPSRPRYSADAVQDLGDGAPVTASSAIMPSSSGNMAWKFLRVGRPGTDGPDRTVIVSSPSSCCLPPCHVDNGVCCMRPQVCNISQPVTSTPTPSTAFYVVNSLSGKCLYSPDGTALAVQTCQGLASEQWALSSTEVRSVPGSKLRASCIVECAMA